MFWLPSGNICCEYSLESPLALAIPVTAYNIRFDEIQNKKKWNNTKQIKALTALMGLLSQSVGWENGPERGLETVSFNP